jgi:hypothetical protein
MPLKLSGDYYPIKGVLNENRYQFSLTIIDTIQLDRA